jgi:putative endonuclease
LQFGREGESAAIAFLKENGYRVLEKNFRFKLGEIDVIAEQAGVIFFIEVKARSDHEFSHPFDVVTPTKQKKIIQTAQIFLIQKRIPDKPMRLDLVALILDPPNSWKIELLENAFQV